MRGLERATPLRWYSLRWSPMGGRDPEPDLHRHRDRTGVPAPFSLGTLPLMALALVLTGAAFFLLAVPLWCAGLPLMLAMVSPHFTSRFVLALAFFFWPALIATHGLTELGHPALPVSLGTALAVLVLPLLMAWLGVVPVSLALLALPVFPASPLFALIDALPVPVSLTGLGLLLLVLMAVESPAAPLTRVFLALLFCAGLGAGHVFADLSAGRTDTRPAQDAWVAHRVPPAITERAGWIRLRDSLPEGAEAILGENLFDQDDAHALAFWRQAAQDRALTLWTGVRAQDGRGTLLRIGPDTTSPGPEPVAAARYGIPGLTGTWGQMPPLENGPDETERIDAGIDWLFCYEALLPWAWVPLLAAGEHSGPPDARAIVVLASDRWLAPLPFHITRRKAARALARMSGREVYFAETGRTVLLRNPYKETANDLD